MSKKVECIYGIHESYRKIGDEWGDTFEIVKEPVVKTTKEFYWIAAEGGRAFGYRKSIYKDVAHITAQAAIDAYKLRLEQGVTSRKSSLANAESKLDKFNDTFETTLEVKDD